MIRYIHFKSLLLLALIFVAPSTDVHAISVDIYVAMESGNDGEVLTSEIMEASTHGGVDSVLGAPDWTLVSGDCDRPECPGCTSRDMWVSTDNVRELPGTVTVDGVDYISSGTYTWKFSDMYKWNFVKIEYGSQRQYTYKPWHPRTTIACFYTPNPDQLSGFGCTFDNIILPVYNSYSVLQTIGETTIGSVNGMFLYSGAV